MSPSGNGPDPVEEWRQTRDGNPEVPPWKLAGFGDYDLIEEIARGGMGIVFKARQVSLNRVVALKLIYSGERATEADVSRFRAEAEAAARLDHPNIVPIYEVGECEGRHYFSMKLMEAGTLAQAIEKWRRNVEGAQLPFPAAAAQASKPGFPGPDSQSAIANLIAAVARAVHYAHQHGILHRDLKPGNILLDTQGRPQVADFGLAKRLEGDSAITLSGAILGTPGYIAPEQARGAKQLTTAVDVYSLGAILYELLTGRPPFTGATALETLRRVMSEEPLAPWIVRRQHGNRKSEPRKPNEPRPPGPEDGTEMHDFPASAYASLSDLGVQPSDLDIICLKCLEKDPAHRYGSAEALAEDLERWLRGEPIRARPATVMERLLKWMRRNPLLAAGVAALLLVGALGLAGVLWQWRSAVAARRATLEELWHSQLLDARSYRLSGQPGRREKAVEILKPAAGHRPSVGLRNELLATLAQPDIGPFLWWRTNRGDFRLWTLTSDLTHFAVKTADGRVSVWRETDDAPVVRLPGMNSRAKSMRFSPDDSLLAVKHEDGTLCLWRWRDQQLLMQVGTWPDVSELPSFDFAPDGREFWFSDAAGRLARCSLPGGELLPAPAITNHVRRLRFDKSGGKLAGSAGSTVAALDARSGVTLGEWQAPAEIWCLDWHPRGDSFALGVFRKGVYLAELGQTNLFPFAADPSENVVLRSLSFTPDGDYLLAGGWGNLLIAWNQATRQQEFRSREGEFWQVSRDGARLACMPEDRGLGVRSFLRPVGIRRLRVPTILGDEVGDTAWHPSGRWFLAGHPRGWSLWDAGRGELVRQYEGTTRIWTVQFLPDGSAFLTGGGAGARLWPFTVQNDSPQVGPARTLTSTREIPHERAALSPDGQRFAAVGNHAWVGPVDGSKPPARIEQGDGHTYLGFSPDGRWLCLSRQSGTTLAIHDGFTGAFITNLPTGTAGFFFSPTGRELLSERDGHLTFWQTGTWQPLGELPVKPGLEHYGFTGWWPRGRAFLTESYEGLQLWSLEHNEPVATFHLPLESQAWSVRFDPSGRYFTTASGHPIIDLWDLAALRRELARLGLDWPDDDPGAGFAPRRL